MSNEQRMLQAFNLFDKEGNGYITQDGLKNTLKTLGKSATDQELRTLIGGDVDGMFTARGGKIDFETFCKIYNGEQVAKNDEVKDLQEAFNLLDKDGKGWIGIPEFQLICKQLGEEMTVEEVRSSLPPRMRATLTTCRLIYTRSRPCLLV